MERWRARGASSQTKPLSPGNVDKTPPPSPTVDAPSQIQGRHSATRPLGAHGWPAGRHGHSVIHSYGCSITLMHGSNRVCLIDPAVWPRLCNSVHQSSSSARMPCAAMLPTAMAVHVSWRVHAPCMGKHSAWHPCAEPHSSCTHLHAAMPLQKPLPA